MSDKFDVAVIGAGPAGYVAAIRCAQLGLKTVCIDDWVDARGKAALGGTCLNVGCIPSKALLDSSEKYHQLKNNFKLHGITAENVAMDVGMMMKRKAKIVSTLTRGVTSLLKANSITTVHARGQFVGQGEIVLYDPISKIKNADVKAEHVILAVGSVPIELSSIPFDGERIVDSAGALEFDAVPQRLGIVGAGVIGLELGSVWNRLGSQVTILEALSDFLPAVDDDVSAEAAKNFKKQGLNIQLGAKVSTASVRGNVVDISYAVGDKDMKLEVDRLVVCVGRKPCTNGLAAEGSGIQLDDRGFIQVDDHCMTTVPNTYAVGDCVRGPMLAHKGSEEGVAVAERIATGYGHINYETVPWAIYTAPEIAWVGASEKEVKAAGGDCHCGKFPFAATGRAKAMEDTAGFVKVVADATSDRILGVHIIGPHASELIAEAVVAMEYHASSEDLARIIHAHPTLSEAVHEAALSVDSRSIHRVN